MHQTSEPDLEDTLAGLEQAIEEFHNIRDAIGLSSNSPSLESAEQEKAAELSPVSALS